MKAVGVVRCTDNLGRVVIPFEMQKAAGWIGKDVKGTDRPKVPLEMFATENGVFLRKYAPGKPAPTDTQIDPVEM